MALKINRRGLVNCDSDQVKSHAFASAAGVPVAMPVCNACVHAVRVKKDVKRQHLK